MRNKAQLPETNDSSKKKQRAKIALETRAYLSDGGKVTEIERGLGQGLIQYKARCEKKPPSSQVITK